MKNNNSPHSFSRTRVFLFLTSLVLILSGLLLMSGEGTDSETFRSEIFSPLRIGLAPILCLTGYLLVIVGIMYSKKEYAK